MIHTLRELLKFDENERLDFIELDKFVKTELGEERYK